MASLPIYHCSKALAGCWWIPLEHIGCVIERFPNRGIIRRASAKVGIGFDEDGFILVFSALLRRLGKNSRLAEEVERILLASGAKVYGAPISTNLLYRVCERPNHVWLNRLNSDAITVRSTNEVSPRELTESRSYPLGWLCGKAAKIRFWTGPAIEPKTEKANYYVALDADVSSLAIPHSESFLNSIDVALSRNGAARLEVQLNMDALKK